MNEHNGKSLKEAVTGKSISNDYGECHHIRTEYDFRIDRGDQGPFQEKILTNLRLLYGIGTITERRLKRKGCRTIKDLMQHQKWGKEARRFLDIYNSKDVFRIDEWLSRWISRSHPSAFHLAGFYQDTDYLFFDIETLGIFERPIILFGVGQLKGNRFEIDQYLLRDIGDEPGALVEFLSHLEEGTALVSYNGKSFDEPYIRGRLGYYGMELIPDRMHFDCLPFARRMWKDTLPDCKLTTLERFVLKLERDMDIPSFLVPEFYQAFMEHQNVGPLVPIVEHNRSDILTLAKIFYTIKKELVEPDV